jgi:hypothetical protein|tara:strand:- start:884 stop:1480 length:597 start_codon:yes stop_codon:yes gene_type:complete
MPIGIMEKIAKVQLGLNKEMEVMVTSEIAMATAADRDDVYFVMFNVLDKPLRFVVSTAGNFTEFLVARGIKKTQIDTWLSEDPDQFLNNIVQYQQDLISHSVEKVKVVLDSQKNADMARAVVSSMIEKGYFVNVSNYAVPGTKETLQKIQKVPTAQLIEDFKTMLEVIKQWEGFDFETFLRAKGVPEENIATMLEGTQ